MKLVSSPAAGENVYYFYSDTTVLIPIIHNVRTLLLLYILHSTWTLSVHSNLNDMFCNFPFLIIYLKMIMHLFHM